MYGLIALAVPDCNRPDDEGSQWIVLIRAHVASKPKTTKLLIYSLPSRKQAPRLGLGGIAEQVSVESLVRLSVQQPP